MFSNAGKHAMIHLALLLFLGFETTSASEQCFVYDLDEPGVAAKQFHYCIHVSSDGANVAQFVVKEPDALGGNACTAVVYDEGRCSTFLCILLASPIIVGSCFCRIGFAGCQR